MRVKDMGMSVRVCVCVCVCVRLTLWMRSSITALSSSLLTAVSPTRVETSSEEEVGAFLLRRSLSCVCMCVLKRV